MAKEFATVDQSVVSRNHIFEYVEEYKYQIEPVDVK